jgi:hypothetical protein
MKKLLFLTFILLPQLLLAQIEMTLLLKQSPESNFSVELTDTTILTGSSVALAKGFAVSGGSGSFIYRRTPVIGLSNINISNPVAAPTNTTVYLLNLTDKTGCSLYVTYTIIVRTPLVYNRKLLNNQTLDATL